MHQQLARREYAPLKSEPSIRSGAPDTSETRYVETAQVLTCDEVHFVDFGHPWICADEIRRHSAGQLDGRTPHEVQHLQPIGGQARRRQRGNDSLCPRGSQTGGACSDLKSGQVLALALQLVDGGKTGTSPVLARHQLGAKPKPTRCRFWFQQRATWALNRSREQFVGSGARGHAAVRRV